MGVIELKNVKRYYHLGSRNNEEVIVRALQGIDLSAEAGEFIAIMGPSGSGKSTLMNILGCLDKPSEGSYLLDKIETAKSDSDTFAWIRNRKIGFVFQSFNLLAKTTALENVSLPLFYNRSGSGKDHRAEKKWTNGTIKARAEEVLRDVGLSERLYHMPSQLSGGQQQRVAIARAMVNDPAFILADEPTGNLDTEMTLEIMTLFQNLNDQGKTILMVTHEPELAAYTKRVVTLRDGQIVSDVAVSERARAAEALEAWKRDHAILAAGESAMVTPNGLADERRGES